LGPCQGAVGLASLLGEDQAIAAARRSLGNLLVRENRLPEGIDHLLAALAAAEAAGDPAEAAECCGSLAPAYFWQGALNASAEITHRRAEFARLCHDPYQMRHIQTWLAMLAGLQGHIPEAFRLLDEAENDVARLSSPEPAAWITFCRGAFDLFLGRLEPALTQLEAACAVFRSFGPGALVWYQGMLCIALAANRKREAASKAAAELEAMLAAVPDESMATAEALVSLCQTAMLLGDDGRLAGYYPRLLAFEGQFHDAVVDRLLAESEMRAGDFESASRHLDSAETLCRTESMAWDLAATLTSKAALLSLQPGGSATSVDALREEAARLYRDLGRDSDVEPATAELPAASAAGRGLPAGLTRREVEVLRLVAAGKTNHAIAEELVVSEKTVENHLTSIYRKTGADNRAAATAFAIRQGLD
jgi:DNA-binding CsgD family transcriptional regulator/tetratricopeptide (TPR) repeat protein